MKRLIVMMCCALTACADPAPTSSSQEEEIAQESPQACSNSPGWKYCAQAANNPGIGDQICWATCQPTSYCGTCFWSWLINKWTTDGSAFGALGCPQLGVPQPATDDVRYVCQPGWVF